MTSYSMHSGLNERFCSIAYERDDREAFAVIYDAYVQPLYRFVYFRLGSGGSGRRTSEIFMKAWQYLRDVNGRRRFAVSNILIWYRPQCCR